MTKKEKQEFEKMNADISSLYISDDYDYIGDTLLRIRIGFSDYRYYDMVTNELTNGYVHYEYRAYMGQEIGIYKYDIFGERSLLLPDMRGDTFFDDVFIGGQYGETTDSIYDYTGKMIMDLSEYKLTYSASNNGPDQYYLNGYLLSPVDNA